MIQAKTSIFFVGTDIEDAKKRGPYELVEAALTEQEKQDDSIVYEADNYVVASSMKASQYSPTEPEENFIPVKEESPFANYREMEMFQIGESMETADEPFPYIDGETAKTIAAEFGWNVYDIQTFINLDSLRPVDWL